MNARLAGWAIAAMLGLAGCSTTVFESFPTGARTDCDPAWPGRWLSTEGEADAKSRDAVEIAADCRSATSEGERKPMHLTLVDTGDARYLQVHNDSEAPDCIGEGSARCGVALLRYEREGDTIRIFDADHARIAAAIESGEIEGSSEIDAAEATKATREPVYRNFVAGDAAGIARLLRRHPDFFAGDPLLVLRRVPADPAPPSPGDR
jgi:hypothetical protein